MHMLPRLGWVTETLNTLGECHTMLWMNKDIFLDLHDVLVERYGLHDTSVLYHAMEVDAQIFPHHPQGTNITNILHAQFRTSHSYAIF